MFRVLFLCVILSMSAAMKVTPETWKDLSVDKTVFVRFVGPACTYCLRMQPDWDKLVEELTDSETVAVVQVDCGNPASAFCQERGVTSYPQIKVGHVGHLEDYTMSHDFLSLHKFARSLKAPCNPDTLQGCHEHHRREVRRLQSMTTEELEAFVENVRLRTKLLEDDLIVQKKRMMKEYRDMIREHEEAIADLHKEGDIALHNIVLHHRNEL